MEDFHMGKMLVSVLVTGAAIVLPLVLLEDAVNFRIL